MEQENNPTKQGQEKPKGKWGGARIGSGRPKTVAKKYGFCAPADVATILDNVASKSDFICEAIRYYNAHLNKQQ